ncbi:MAG TPA: DUF4190 domain-containing protein [Gemmataceae bacterium]|nr:DUF4190 domain-containing protein [Gemmataceae bacterium]
MADDAIQEDDGEKSRRKKRRVADDDDGDRPRSVKKRAADDGGVGTVIPYRNAPALIGYYCGVFGLISCFLGPGAIFGAVPLILGIMGLKRAGSDPEARGTAHAWIAIILGAIELLVGCGVSGFFIFGLATAKR